MVSQQPGEFDWAVIQYKRKQRKWLGERFAIIPAKVALLNSRIQESPVWMQKNRQSLGYCENTKDIQLQCLQKKRKALKVKMACTFTVVEIKNMICQIEWEKIFFVFEPDLNLIKRKSLLHVNRDFFLVTYWGRISGWDTRDKRDIYMENLQS